MVALFDESGVLAEFYTDDGFGQTVVWTPVSRACIRTATRLHFPGTYGFSAFGERVGRFVFSTFVLQSEGHPTVRRRVAC